MVSGPNFFISLLLMVTKNFIKDNVIDYVILLNPIPLFIMGKTLGLGIFMVPPLHQIRFDGAPKVSFC